MLQSFSERMADAKTLAQVERNKGRHTGASAKGWNYKRPVEDCHASRINQIRKAWRSDCLEIRNQFLVACVNMHDNPDNWEF